jgi:hypothetical protein
MAAAQASALDVTKVRGFVAACGADILRRQWVEWEHHGYISSTPANSLSTQKYGFLVAEIERC